MIKRLMSSMIILMASIISSETVVGESAPFSFPGGIGITNNTVLLNQGKSLKCRLMKNGSVYFTWSMSAKAQNGKISIYSISGKLIKTFTLASAKGFIRWDTRKSNISNGIYFAHMKAGSVKQVVKFSIL